MNKEILRILGARPFTYTVIDVHIRTKILRVSLHTASSGISVFSLSLPLSPAQITQRVSTHKPRSSYRPGLQVDKITTTSAQEEQRGEKVEQGSPKVRKTVDLQHRVPEKTLKSRCSRYSAPPPPPGHW